MPGQPIRLYSKGTMMGYKRGLRNQHPAQSRIKIEGVDAKKDAEFYHGKRVAYLYRAKKIKKGVNGKESTIRVIWGKVIGSHGNNGTVRAKFRNNLPPKSIGKSVRVMLYPSRV